MRYIINKRYVRELIKKEGLKVSKEFIDSFINSLEEHVKLIVKEAVGSARTDKRKTIKEKDLIFALKQKTLRNLTD